MESDFLIVDVFTQEPFGGNQLGVFPDGSGLSDRAMQAITRELNFSETTFVLPATRPGCSQRVRIFTPRMELPFAGHPTVGTAAALAHLGRAAWSDGRAQLRFEEGVGAVDVEVRRERQALMAQLTLASAVDVSAAPLVPGAVAAVLSLPADRVAETWFAGAGVSFCYARLTSRDEVDRAILDRAAWTTQLATAWSPHLFFFSGELRSGAELYARMFAPALGVEEDPATGSASAILAGVAATRSREPDAEVVLHIDQGHAMGRPSRIRAHAAKADGRVQHIGVGGAVTVVARGTMTIPDGY